MRLWKCCLRLESPIRGKAPRIGDSGHINLFFCINQNNIVVGQSAYLEESGIDFQH